MSFFFFLDQKYCKILCSTFLPTYSANSAMCFRCQPHSSSPRRNKSEAITDGKNWRPALLSSCSLGWWLVVQSLSRVWFFVTPLTALLQASLSTIPWSLLILMSIESVMPFNHLILSRPFLLLPSIFPRIRVFSNESALCIKWPKYWSFSFSIIPSKEIPELIFSEWTGWISLQSKGLARVFSNTTVQKHQFFGSQPSSQSNSHIHTWLLEKP